MSLVFNNITSGRIPATALFNKLTGVYVQTVSVPIDQFEYNKDYYIARPIEFNFSSESDGDVIEGHVTINPDGTTVDDFKVVARSERIPVITETMLNTLAEEKITGKYPLVEQLNVVAKAIQRIAIELKLEETDELVALQEMRDYIKLCLQINQTKKEFYRDDINTQYISDEEADDLESRRLEGGIHEELGARNVNGGRVFKSSSRRYS